MTWTHKDFREALGDLTIEEFSQQSGYKLRTVRAYWYGERRIPDELPRIVELVKHRLECEKDEI